MLNDTGCERAVLAGICQYGIKGYTEISDIINTGIFTETKNQLIYGCLEHIFLMDRKTVDIPGIFSAANSLKYESQICEKPNDQAFIRSLFNYSLIRSSILFTIKIF